MSKSRKVHKCPYLHRESILSKNLFYLTKKKKAEYRQHVMDDIQLLFLEVDFLQGNNLSRPLHLLFFLRSFTFLRLTCGPLRRFILDLL